MKYFDLDSEEKQILKDFDEEKFVSTATAEAKARYQEYAAETLSKTKKINIRLSEKDIQKLKARAVESGIPYQTLASSVLHRFAKKGEIHD
jgi:predicted DNA binding CopG/RHH family protein